VPTYDYVCEACGHEFEAFQSMSEKRLRKCPKCGKSRLVRKVGAGAGLIFKGSGFYVTDYKKSGGASKPSEPQSESSSASKSETKDTGSKSSGGGEGASGAGGGGTPKAKGKSKDGA
jgi:putative FmdB family regulatory protein